ncbi:MAG: GNAT family N-acetyltransferase [Alphaproteobacteria bacterium]|nr:GNAT family N-acetyltransferase [Alphaproteobacteria bacterium]
MLNNLTLRPAEEKDLPDIIRLFIEDELGASREVLSNPISPSYQQAFQDIQEDKNQALWVVVYKGHVIGTYHLTTLPSLSFKGSRRLNLENIHVDQRFQGQGVGTWMINKAIAFGHEKNCKIIQLTTNKKRLPAKTFYEKLGFVATHEGMKLYL